MDIASIYILGSTTIPIVEIHLFYSLETGIMTIKIVVGKLTLSILLDPKLVLKRISRRAFGRIWMRL